jgi:predicted RND superfamily exporter protein
VLLASLTTALGFAALMLGDYGAMRSLGLVMTIGIGGCLIGSVLVLPTVLLLLRKAR